MILNSRVFGAGDVVGEATNKGGGQFVLPLLVASPTTI